MSAPVRIERHGAVALLTLDRASRRNALDLEMRAAIADAFADFDADDKVRSIVITGGDEVFAAGADLRLLADRGAQEVADIDLPRYWAPLARCRKPVIAAVCGAALGAGCELALMCDILVAGRSARFGQPEARVGIMPGAGGTQRLIRVLGKHVASLLLMTGESLHAERAYQLGLVSELRDDGVVLQRALVLAQAAAQLPPKAIAAIKRTLALGADLPLDAALALEHREFLLLFDTQDQTEGMRAFLEKRQPQFTGR